MTSKVLIKMPEVPFSQVNNVKKPNNEILTTVSNADLIRSVSQLQENIRFLQLKHQQMLTSLHDEVDILRQKNRDLQFQLVFSKNNSPVASSSNAEDANEAKSARADDESKAVDDGEIYKKRCIQLEKELAVTKSALHTSLARTAALQALLQQHKIQEVPWIAQQCGRAANIVESRSNSDSLAEGGEEVGRLQARLEEAERLVRRLRAETDEQRRELQSIKASLSAAGRGSGGGGNGGGRGGGNHRGGIMHQRFPPLQNQQAFWQQQGPSQQRENNEYQGWNRGNRRSNEKSDNGIQGVGVNPGLPDLRANNSQPPYNNGNSNNGQNQNQSRRGMGNHGYNNHYYRNSDRGHRGGGDSRNYRDVSDDQQHKNYNTPNEQSEGEVDQGLENTRNNSYKNKRGHNKHQDKS